MLSFLSKTSVDSNHICFFSLFRSSLIIEMKNKYVLVLVVERMCLVLVPVT